MNGMFKMLKARRNLKASHKAATKDRAEMVQKIVRKKYPERARF
jgi:hypothetical protein